MTTINEIGDFEVTVSPNGIFSLYIDETLYTSTSWAGLHSKVEDVLRKKAKERRLSLPVLTVEGIGVITGVNLHTGRITGLGSDVREVWPNVPWIEAQLEEVKRLHTQLIHAEAALQPYRLPLRLFLPGYAKVTAENYAEALDSLEAAYKKKLESAQQRQERAGTP